MTHFATTVVRLLDELKRLTSPDAHVPQSAYSEDARAPKRPWEDVVREEEIPGPSEVREIGFSASGDYDN